MAFRMIGEVTDAAMEALTGALPCPRCGANMWWVEEPYYGFALIIRPNKLVRIVSGVGGYNGDLPDPDVVHALLTRFRIVGIDFHDRGIRSVLLDCGIVVEFGVSRFGPIVTRITRGEEYDPGNGGDEGNDRQHEGGGQERA